MERVRVNRNLLIGVVAIAAAALLSVAFLLGRASGSGGAVVQPPGSSQPGNAPLPASDPRSREPVPLPSSAAATIADPGEAASAPWPAPLAPERHTEAPVAAPVSAPAAAGRRGGDADPDRAAVAAYLDGIDHVQPGKMGGDAEGIAGEMAAALAKGDTSGLDRMIRETEAAKERLAALAPPAPCAAHYRESLGSLDDALETLRSLKAALGSPEPASQLAGVTARATALRSRSEVLQKEELALRHLYDLTR